MANALVLNAAELLRRPGSERDVDLAVQPDELDVDDPRLVPGAPVTGRLHLESLGDGIVLTGAVTAEWAGTCRRCLGAATGTATADVHEIYQSTLTDPDAFELTGDQLDLRPMVRELVLLELPDAPVCRDDCAGLCPTCGVDRNEATCTCATTATDPRWDALGALRAELD